MHNGHIEGTTEQSQLQKDFKQLYQQIETNQYKLYLKPAIDILNKIDAYEREKFLLSREQPAVKLTNNRLKNCCFCLFTPQATKAARVNAEQQRIPERLMAIDIEITKLHAELTPYLQIAENLVAQEAEELDKFSISSNLSYQFVQFV